MIGAPGLLVIPSSLYQHYHSYYAFAQPNLKHSFVNFKRSNANLWTWKAQIEDNIYGLSKSKLVLDVQTLKNFPVEKLHGEVVMLRFDSAQLLDLSNIRIVLENRSLSTIIYLYNAGAKMLLVSNWGRYDDAMILSAESVADHLSSLLQVKVVALKPISSFMQIKSEDFQNADILLFENLALFREELANCSAFSEKLAHGVGIFVNDAFFLSHKILASTVGATRYCHSRLAGFHFEEKLLHLKNLREITMRPYFVIIGGGKFLEKTAALCQLASVCDGLIFVGMIAFQVMHVLGISVPSCFLECDSFQAAAELMEIVNRRKIIVYFPMDLLCANNDKSNSFEVFPSNRLLRGWTPIDLGPVSLKEIHSLLSKCKKVLWIGRIKFSSSANGTASGYELAHMLKTIRKSGCDITVVGNAACQSILAMNSSFSQYKMFENASVVWGFLKGITLPGVAALDQAYPYEIDWNTIYEDPIRPLAVDIGSGNGLFLLKMAEKWKAFNFLGLEINNKSNSTIELAIRVARDL